MRITACLLGVVALGAGSLVAGCGEREEPLGGGGGEKFTLMLDYTPNADHAPIYAALERGYFEEVGLDVEIRQPNDTIQPIPEVASGRVDLAISYEPEVLIQRDEGVRVKAVGALIQVPLTSIMSLPAAGIEGPADLKGKRVGTAGIPYQEKFLETILDGAGVDPDAVEVKNVGFDFTKPLLTGRVDATLGGYWNYEGTILEVRGEDPQIIRLDEVGVPAYDELVFVANESGLEASRERIRRFIAAVARAVRDIQRKPADAVDDLLAAEPELDPEIEQAAISKTLPLFSPPRDQPFGFQDGDEWEEFGRWLRANGLIERIPDTDDAFTNELLPGEA